MADVNKLLDEAIKETENLNEGWNGNPFLDKKVMGVVNNLIRR